MTAAATAIAARREEQERLGERVPRRRGEDVAERMARAVEADLHEVLGDPEDLAVSAVDISSTSRSKNTTR